MNYMEEIAKMLGVKLEEEFTLKGMGDTRYKLSSMEEMRGDYRMKDILGRELKNWLRKCPKLS